MGSQVMSLLQAWDCLMPRWLIWLIALLMHLFGWGSGKADLVTFVVAGFLLLALHVVTGWQPWHRGT
jgi:hypothetical protein